MCKGFCEKFNPVKYNKDLDGGLNKLFSFYVSLKHKSERN